MAKLRHRAFPFAISALALAAATNASAANFDIPRGNLDTALDSFSAQSGVILMVPNDAIRGVRTRGIKGSLSAEAALASLLKGTGFSASRDPSGVVAIVQGSAIHFQEVPQTRLMQTAQKIAAAATGIESVVVTSSKIKGDIQTVPIAITALSQEQLTSRQIAGGPDLVKEVPNLTFTKTNFSGYSIQIRGIGTQAISVTTDPAVAVALNDTPFIRNHFFEQEFYDVGQLEVLRGPQGTLYGRNATAGVVNIVSAKPTDQFEAMLSADIGNYHNRRFEGMVNIPVVDDRLDIRAAGEWTKREGYSINNLTGSNIDGRDLWSSRITVGWKPADNFQAYLVWEHFQESDDRMRTAKQLCHKDEGLQSLGGITVSPTGVFNGLGQAFALTTAKFSQGCLPASLYAPESFEVPNGFSLPYVTAGYVSDSMDASIDPYASTVQSRNLRVIETQIDPRYQAKNDTVELNADFNVTPALTFTSATGYNQDFLWSTEDYNRFNTSPGIFRPTNSFFPTARTGSLVSPYSDCATNFTTADGKTNPLPQDGTYYFADPQLGCSNRLVAQDISREHAWQLSQEFRLASNFTGPLNFSVGGNYMHYETVEDYYVFANALTLFAATSASSDTTAWVPNVTDNSECLAADAFGVHSGGYGQQYNDPLHGAGQPTSTCYSIDPSPLNAVNDGGHNYFLSRNPYVLNSYAAFGETYYDVFADLKLTGGIRWTNDRKHFLDIPSELLANGYGYMVTKVVDQQWNELTGRLAANWTPKLDFTEQTLIYGSYAHGYKAGGANPPGAPLYSYGAGAGVQGVPIHPFTFEPEFVDAFELGSKNTLLDGGLTLNGNVFYYNYKGYQISEIVDRTSINLNFDATVRGAELEATYEPAPGLKFNFAGGYEATKLADGSKSVDLMDRTDKANHPDWVLMKPFVTQSSNCVFPDYVVIAMLAQGPGGGQGNPSASACGYAYESGFDPVTLGQYNDAWAGPDDPSRNLVTGQPYYSIPNFGAPTLHGYPVTISYPGYPTQIYPGFDPATAPNNGAGFDKDLSGNQLPNAPHFTVSFGAEYTMPLSEDWAGTLHSDFYWQSQSFARVFNDVPYDKIRGYSSVNLALILTSAQGWQVMGYLKNVFDTTAITGTFLNSDDSGLTTNVFLTDPRLYGVRVTKNW